MSMTTESPARSPSIDQLRNQAIAAAGRGRFEEARALLQRAIAQDGAPKLEVMSDIAAVELRAGDLVRSIELARHVISKAPEHDEAHFTLAMSLSAIGSYAEAIELLEVLIQGERGVRFSAALPELAALVAAEVVRLTALRPARPTRPAVPVNLGTSGFDLSHLVQAVDSGQVQNEEALLLYSVVRTMRVRRVLEIGGLAGYSARNFLSAMAWDVDTALYTVDINPVASQAANHFTLCKDAALVDAVDLHGKPLDLVFFDCHVYDAQMKMFVRLVEQGIITDATLIALHDTGLFPQQSFAPWSYAIRDADGGYGYVHQEVERKMVNTLRQEFGYDAFCAHVDVRRNDERLPYRKGLTLMKKFFELRTR